MDRASSCQASLAVLIGVLFLALNLLNSLEGRGTRRKLLNCTGGCDNQWKLQAVNGNLLQLPSILGLDSPVAPARPNCSAASLCRNGELCSASVSWRIARTMHSAGYQLEELTPPKLFNLIKGRTLWFLGDSQTRNFFLAAGCFLHQFATDCVRRNATSDPEILKDLSEPHAAKFYQNAAVCQHLHEGTRLCVVVGYDSKWLVKRSLPALRLLPNITKDILVWNVGLHDRVLPEYEALLQHAAAFIQANRATLPKMVWMDTPPQHFTTPGGEYSTEVPLGTCVDIHNKTAMAQGGYFNSVAWRGQQVARRALPGPQADGFLLNSETLRNLSPEARKVFQEAQENIIEINKGRIRALEELKTAKKRIAELENQLQEALEDANQAAAQVNELKSVAASFAAVNAAPAVQAPPPPAVQAPAVQAAAPPPPAAAPAPLQQQQAPPAAAAPQHDVLVVYDTAWNTAYLHFNADGKGWTNIPGNKMEEGSGEYQGKKLLRLSCKRVEFVMNNGKDDWDHPDQYESGGTKNYVITSPGVYFLKAGKINKVA